MKLLINMLSISRIFIGLLIFFMISQSVFLTSAFILFLLASFSDFLDGYLARKHNHTSIFGGIIDQISDKILVIFVLLAITIEYKSFYIGFCLGLIILRDIWVSALRDYNSSMGNANATLVIYAAKIKTSIQFFALTTYLLSIVLNNNLIFIIAELILFLTVMITIYTGIIYTYRTFSNE